MTTTTPIQTKSTSAENKRLPGPRSIPIPYIGHIASVIRLNGQTLPFLRDHYQRYGALSALSGVRDGKPATVVALSPEYNKIVLSDPSLFYSPNLTSFKDSAMKRLTSGLVTMNGERHRQQRRLMMPAFHKGAVASYRDLMVHYTDEMLSRWKSGTQISLAPELRQLILRIVSHSLFGIDEPDINERLGNLIYRWTRILNDPKYLFLPVLKGRLNRLSEEVENKLLTLISEKRAAGTGGNDVLSMLIQAHDEDGTRLTDTELIGHLAILFIAGHETTVNALAWTLLLLAQYPALRMALIEEINGLTGGAAPTVEQAYALPLLDHVIKESMRLLPPAVYTMRLGIEPFELGGYSLAKDSAVFLSHYITHRLPEIYAEPDHFNPARWEQLDVSPYEYMPFSAGPRMCIGATFASLEMRIVLAMLLPRIQVMPLDKVDYQVSGGILHPKGDVPCAVRSPEERDATFQLSGSMTTLIA